MEKNVEYLSSILGISLEEADSILDACNRDVERSVDFFFTNASQSSQNQQPRYDGPNIQTVCKIFGQGNDLSLSSVRIDGVQIGQNGWSGFRIIVFDPSDWSIMSDKVYCAYTPNKAPEMKVDVASLPLGIPVLVATTDATCNADATNRSDVLGVMKSLGSVSFEEAYRINPMRTAYCGLLRKGGFPIQEDALPGYGTSLSFELEGGTRQSLQCLAIDNSIESMSSLSISFDSPIKISHHPHELQAILGDHHDTDSCGLCDSNRKCAYYCSVCNWHICRQCAEMPPINITIVQAIKSRNSKAVINSIIQKNPDCLKQREESQLPLHWALFMGNFEVFLLLLDAYPDGCKEKYADGWLCIHTVVSNESCSLALFDRLLAAYPDGARVKNMDGLIAIQLAVVKRIFNDHVFASLIAADLPFDPTTASRVDHHAYSWTWVLDANNSVPVETCLKLVHTTFARFPRLIHSLAHAEDERGRQAIMIAHKDVRAVIASYIHFMGQYEVRPGPPLHRSATALVVCAVDHRTATETALMTSKLFGATSDSLVALKFMKHKDQFVREVTARSEYSLNGEYVLRIDCSFDASKDDRFLAETRRSSEWSDYSFCIVMKAADRNLKNIIDSEHICGRDWDAIKNVSQQIAKAIEHLHSCDVIHADIKPLNIVRVGAKMKLIDLDASSRYLAKLQVSGVKWSSAYLPPEMIHVDSTSGEGSVKLSAFSQQGAIGQSLPYDSLVAHPSQDMWSFGCVLYNLCTGETLWPSNCEDNISDNDILVQLAQWGTQHVRIKKLAKIADPVARNLVSLLLSADPTRRPPSMLHVRRHPFFTGQLMSRLPENRATFDVFISYRVDSDLATAELLYNMLSERGLNVWWDKKCLIAGKNWEDGFCHGLVHSNCFVPVLSRSGMQSRFESLTEFAACDNVLLEFRMALELERRGLLENVYPLFVGDHSSDASGKTSYGHYFAQGCQPVVADVVVNTVEDKLVEHLEKQGLGMPLRDRIGLKTILTELFAHQGGFLMGENSIEVLLAEHVSVLALASLSRRPCGATQDDHKAAVAVTGATIENGSVSEYARSLAAKEALLLEALSEIERLKQLLGSPTP